MSTCRIAQRSQEIQARRQAPTDPRADAISTRLCSGQAEGLVRPGWINTYSLSDLYADME